MKKVLILMILGATFLSCSPIKRHQRLVERHPYVHTEQITTVHDTFKVIVPQVTVDTVTHVNFDTVIIEKDRLRVQLVRVHDSIYVEGECKSDTITVTRTIEVPTFGSENPQMKWWRPYVIGAWIFIFINLAVIIWRSLRK